MFPMINLADTNLQDQASTSELDARTGMKRFVLRPKLRIQDGSRSFSFLKTGGG